MSEETSNKTTEEHFDIFKAECERWIKVFGLHSYHVLYCNKECEGNNFAEITINHDGRVASLNLNPDWGDIPITEAQLRRTAFHEVCELLIGKLSWCAECRYTTPEEIEEATHFIIRTLENTVFDQEKPQTANLKVFVDPRYL